MLLCLRRADGSCALRLLAGTLQCEKTERYLAYCSVMIKYSTFSVSCQRAPWGFHWYDNDLGRERIRSVYLVLLLFFCCWAELWCAF